LAELTTAPRDFRGLSLKPPENLLKILMPKYQIFAG
jgi:hypothetical protein